MRGTTVPIVAKGLAGGLVAGLAASWVMNRFQAALSKLLEGRKKPHGAQSLQDGTPNHGASAELQKSGKEEAEDNAAERTANFIADEFLDLELSKEQKRKAGAAVHYVFGGMTGAVYGMVTILWPITAIGAGLPFGAAVWLLADEIVVPSAGLSKAPQDYPLSKHAYAITSHLVYGMTTEVIRKLVNKTM